MQIIFSVSLVCLYIIEVLFYLHVYTIETETWNLKEGSTLGTLRRDQQVLFLKRHL